MARQWPSAGRVAMQAMCGQYQDKLSLAWIFFTRTTWFTVVMSTKIPVRRGCANFLSDLQPANILFTVNEIQCRDFLIHPQFSPVRWLPGITPDSSAPRYLMVSQRPRGMLDDASASSLMVKIGDLGGGKVVVDCSRSSLLTASLWNSHPNKWF